MKSTSSITTILTPIIFAVSIFVGALLLCVVFRFNEKANPTPSALTHHTGLEVAWTIAAGADSRLHRHSVIPAARP